MYNKAKVEYHREQVSPFIVAHHVVSAVESEDGEIYYERFVFWLLLLSGFLPLDTINMQVFLPFSILPVIVFPSLFKIREGISLVFNGDEYIIFSL